MRNDTFLSALRDAIYRFLMREDRCWYVVPASPVLVSELRGQISDALGRGWRCSHGYPAAIDAVAITWGPEPTVFDSTYIEFRYTCRHEGGYAGTFCIRHKVIERPPRETFETQVGDAVPDETELID